MSASWLPLLLLPLVLLLLVFLERKPCISWEQCRCEGQQEVGAGPAREEDVQWLRQQLEEQQVRGAEEEAEWQRARKGINPRTRQQQLSDLRRYHGISHYENGSMARLECPGELLVEQHHSNYGEPWAGGRDVFEFLAAAVSLQPQQRVLEVGCGTLRVGLHFIRYLQPAHFHCLERDVLSLLAALLYELPAGGLLYKRPKLVRSRNLTDTSFYEGPYHLIYASAVFLHMPDSEVWQTLAVLGPTLAGPQGRLYVSHNLKFCTRLPAGDCQARLFQAGLVYVGKRTHNSLLFNHYEIWHAFKRRLL